VIATQFGKQGLWKVTEGVSR